MILKNNFKRRGVENLLENLEREILRENLIWYFQIREFSLEYNILHVNINASH